MKVLSLCYFLLMLLMMCMVIHWRRKQGGVRGDGAPLNQGARGPMKICVRSCAFAIHVPFPVSCALN